MYTFVSTSTYKPNIEAAARCCLPIQTPSIVRSKLEICTWTWKYASLRTMLFEYCICPCWKPSRNWKKNVACLRCDTINSADAPNINRIMTTTPNVTANGTYYIEQVNCNEGTHELVCVALTLLITSLSALSASFLQLRRRWRSTTASIERVLTPTTTIWANLSVSLSQRP